MRKIIENMPLCVQNDHLWKQAQKYWTSKPIQTMHNSRKSSGETQRRWFVKVLKVFVLKKSHYWWLSRKHRSNCKSNMFHCTGKDAPGRPASEVLPIFSKQNPILNMSLHFLYVLNPRKRLNNHLLRFKWEKTGYKNSKPENARAFDAHDGSVYNNTER